MPLWSAHHPISQLNESEAIFEIINSVWKATPSIYFCQQAFGFCMAELQFYVLPEIYLDSGGIQLRDGVYLCSMKCSEPRLHPAPSLILWVSFSESMMAAPRSRYQGRGSLEERGAEEWSLPWGATYWKKCVWEFSVARGVTIAEMVICSTKFLLSCPLYRFAAERQLFRQNWLSYFQGFGTLSRLVCIWKW